MKRIWQQWWRLPLLVGVGALFNYGARATLPHGSWNEADVTTTERLRGGEVLLKLESDNIYFSEDAGRTYHELELTATPETKRLKRLLEQQAPSASEDGVKIGPTLVAHGAGGLQWARPQPVRASDVSAEAQQAAGPATPATDHKMHASAAPKETARTKPE